MDRRQVFDRIASAVAESSTGNQDWGAVDEETTIASLGFDSLAILDLLFDLEQEFGIQLQAVEVQGVATVGDLVTLLLARLEAAGNVGEPA